MSEPPATGPETFSEWAILELMGHRQRAGKVSQVELFGSPMLRLDIYDGAGEVPRITQFYGGGAVYCLTVTTEEIARRVGAASLASAAPVARWQLEQEPAYAGAPADYEG